MADVIVAQRMWQRRDTTANWNSANPVLAAGEIGVELTTPPKFKIGDGVTVWTSLAYQGNGGAGLLSGAYSFQTATATPPANKNVRFNNATVSAVTEVYISDTTSDNKDATNILGLIKAGDVLYFQDSNDATKYARFTASGVSVDNGAYFTVPVTHVLSAGAIANNAGISFLLSLGAASAGGAPAYIGATFDGGGADIAVGSQCDVFVPYAFTITKVTMLGDAAGSMVIDVWKDTYGNYPPTVADTITAAAKPTLAAANKSQDATLTGWTTAVAAGTTLRFNVDSCTGIERATILIEGVKS